MLLFGHGNIKIGDVEEPVKAWEVWFHTPWGFCKSVAEAVEACEANEVDPDMAIMPIPVAVGATVYEPFIRA